MNLSFIFSFYICRKFLLSLILIVAIISFVILLSSSLEVARAAHGKEINLSLFCQMVILKFPYLLQKTFSFAILFGGMLCFSQLTKSSELVVARAAGISAWQFLLPTLIATFLIGVFLITLLNPLSSILLNKREKYLQEKATILTVSNSGIWLREHNNEANLIIHSHSFYSKQMRLHNVIFFTLDAQNDFIQRIDAKSALLEKGYWLLKDAKLVKKGTAAEDFKEYKITTKLVLENLQDSFASPETISFWELPGFINALKLAGFSALNHKLHFYGLLAQPIFFCSLILLAAAFSLHLPRQGKTSFLIICGTVAGFILYFFINLTLVFGLAGTIPPFLAGTAPSIVSLLISIFAILHLEDG